MAPIINVWRRRLTSSCVETRGATARSSPTAAVQYLVEGAEER